MKPDQTHKRLAWAALAALAILHAVMLLSLFAGVEPHPPARVAPFGMGPFLGATFAALAAAAIMGPTQTKAGRAVALMAAALSLVSFGPQKLLDPAFPLIWPAVAMAWAAIITLVMVAVGKGKLGPSGRQRAP